MMEDGKLKCWGDPPIPAFKPLLSCAAPSHAYAQQGLPTPYVVQETLPGNRSFSQNFSFVSEI